MIPARGKRSANGITEFPDPDPMSITAVGSPFRAATARALPIRKRQYSTSRSRR
jgi:hypothetical protein